MDWYSLKMCTNKFHGIYKLFRCSKVHNRKLKDITTNYMLFQEKRANFSYMTYSPFWISLVSLRILMKYLPPDFHINFYYSILRKFRVTSATRWWQKILLQYPNISLCPWIFSSVYICTLSRSWNGTIMYVYSNKAILFEKCPVQFPICLSNIRRWILVIFPMLALYQKVYRKLAPFLNPHLKAL